MAYSLEFAPNAKDDFVSCFAYLRAYSEEFAQKHSENLNKAVFQQIAENPYMWNLFKVLGAPYRAYLYKIGRRTQYWIVYRIEEDKKHIRIVRFWNASQNPQEFTI